LHVGGAGIDISPSNDFSVALNKFIVDLCRQLRRNQTPQEEQLWERLRNRKLDGLKFLRQHPFVYGGTEDRTEFFIADFYCAEKKLVVEVDGGIHELQKEYDRGRDDIMSELGLRVLRIQNEELNSVESVVRKIRDVASD
jgi:very-short-patch-repair endonuclease